MASVSLDRATGFAPVSARPNLKLKFDRRRILMAGVVAILGLGAGVYGYEWLTNGRFIESTDDAYVGGNVTAIAPHVAGFVSQLAVEDNQRVRKGQLLLRLDDRDFRAAVDHAEAVVRAQQAALSGLQAKYGLQQSLIHESEADLSARQAQARFAHDDDIRYQGLMRAVATSRQDVQRAGSADEQAQSGVASARAAAAASTQQLAVLRSEIEQARASVAQAEADLRTARLNLGYTEIRAPVDGYVGNRAVRLGAYATIGSELLSIVPAHGLWVDANFKESQIADLHAGQPVSVDADVLPGEAFHGRVVSIAPATGAQFSVLPPENATGNFTKIVQRVPVRILLDGDASQLGRLRPGLSVTADVDTRTGE
jgi:membrane fusion protein (multidrug efflux system)